MSEAEKVLRDLLGLGVAPNSFERLDPRTTWEVFKAFAARPCAADPPERLDGDDLLFQWDDAGVDFTRQFSIADSDGDYDRMEQLHVTFSFDHDETRERIESGHLWSMGRPLEAWINEVEQTDGFALLKLGDKPALATIRQEHV